MLEAQMDMRTKWLWFLLPVFVIVCSRGMTAPPQTMDCNVASLGFIPRTTESNYVTIVDGRSPRKALILP